MFDKLTIRMYDMGIGNCLLLGLWDNGTPTYVLFDCGSQTKDAAHISSVVKDIEATCVLPTGQARIDVVVCTHFKNDHLRGFADPGWDDIEVGEVWMPWTEHPTDPGAIAVRERLKTLEAQAAVTREELCRDKATDDFLVRNSLPDKPAVATLQRGLKGRPRRRYLADIPDEKPIELGAFPGTRFHVLNPKTRQKMRAHTINPSSSQTVSFAGPDDFGACDAMWRVDGLGYRAQNHQISFTMEEQKAVDAVADEPDGDLTLGIVNDVNNDSLVLGVEVGDQLLVFPGDAQWAAWCTMMRNPAAKALLARTTFIKLSQCGSQSGTPPELIAGFMRDGVTALLSTAETADWPNMPSATLLDELSKRCRLVRSDRPAAAGDAGSPGLYVEVTSAILPAYY